MGRAVIFGLFVAFFLWYFQPFHLGNVSNILIVSLIFGAITCACLLFNLTILPKLLPQLFNEDNWVLWKEILFTIFTTAFIGFMNSWYVIYVFHVSKSNWLDVIGQIQLATAAIGTVPIVLMAFYEQNQKLKKNLQKADVLTKKIGALPTQAVSNNQQEEGFSSQKIDFYSENDKLEISIQPQDFLYLKSDGNYLELHYLENQSPQMILLRNTLKKVENSLQEKHYFRCHRSYLVNLNHVASFSGNARGYEISLKKCEHKIPVSRSKTQLLEELV